MRRRPLLTWTLGLLAVVALVAGGLAVGLTHAQKAEALTGSDFNAGNIISDAVFFNTTTMSAADIESFISAKESGCTASKGYPCLKDYTETTPSVAAAQPECAAYSGGSGENAATIIYKVAHACGINPRVLVVMLEKEQGLVTSKAPSASAYSHAMGYNCPDTAPCSASSAGFFKQVYGAAWQLKYYGAHASSYRYHIGTVSIQYNPNTACGSSNVNIQNQATADLYIYTPYQPNSAALRNLTGVGDSCSAYGNRNFWYMFNTWFGSSTSTVIDGSIDSVAFTSGTNSLSYRGWAFDGNYPNNAITMQIAVSGPNGYVGTQSITANGSRPDVAKVYPQAGANHGYSGSFDVTQAGTYQVCISSIWTTGAVLIGCKSVTLSAMPAASIQGSYDEATPQFTSSSGTIHLRGWTFDSTAATKPLALDVTSYAPNGKIAQRTASANATRTDVANVYPSAGAAHGFDIQLPNDGFGSYSVCVTAHAAAAGTDAGQTKLIGCKSFDFGPSAVKGSFDSATLNISGTTASIAIKGWSFDNAAPSTANNMDIWITKPGGSQVGARVTANGSRPDVGTAYSSAGDAHGMTYTYPLSTSAPGTYKVCVYGDGLAAFGYPNTLFGCKSIVFGPSEPTGHFDSVGLTTVDNQAALNIRGWVFDDGLVGRAASADVYVTDPSGKSVGYRVAADASRPDVGKVYPAQGSNHGLTKVVPITKTGKYQVCVFADGAGPFVNSHSLLGCMTLDYTTSPTGHFDTLTSTTSGTTRTLNVRGWMFDEGNPTQTTTSDVWVTAPDGTAKGYRLTANASRPDVGRVYPAAGSNHGLSQALTVTSAGTYKVCVYANGALSAVETHKLLECKSVAVK